MSDWMTGFDLKQYLGERKQRVEECLDLWVPLAYPERLYGSMRYSLLAGGKRLRPILCIASAELLGGEADWVLPTACALEMVHTMSLIHDDLPAMDNDDLRRGRPTNHKIYGDALAILAGDALLAFAFQLIAEKTTVPANRILAVISEVGRAASGPGIVGGQVLDLDAEGQQVTLDHLKIIHAKKTGALLEAAVVSGAVLAGGSEVEVARLRTYAANIGLAFQIVDDILDITGNVAQLGKTPGKDQAVQKATYPSLLGLEGSQRLAEQLVQEAKAQLAPWGAGALPLAALADFVTGREH